MRDCSFALRACLALAGGGLFIACSADGKDTPAPSASSPDAAGASQAPGASQTAQPAPSTAPTASTESVDASTTDANTPDVNDGVFSCAQDSTFPSTIALPEASSATEVELVAGVRELLVIADSGHHGAAMLLPLGSSGTARTITLALDGASSDDIEGSAWRGGKLYTLTSSGAVRRFTPDGAGSLVRDQDTYTIGPDPYSCSNLNQGNCGKDYEGLCLRADSITNACAGYAASKEEGKLYCVIIDAQGHLQIDTNTPPITLSLPRNALSDCAFGAAGGPATGALVITTNGYNLSRSYRVNETNGALTELPTPKILNPEAIAIDHQGALYNLDDHSLPNSMASKMLCKNW